MFPTRLRTSGQQAPQTDHRETPPHGDHEHTHRRHTHHAGTDHPTDLPAHRACTWCATEFPILRRPGRPRIYCDHSCRQRAYEHRHGFRHQRTVRPLPGQAFGEVTRASGYERGGLGLLGTKVHAMRTSVRPEGRRRETLCGALIAPLAGQNFSPTHPNACAVCRTVVRRNPLHLPISTSNELSRLRALIDEVREARIDPAHALRWMAAQQPPRLSPGAP